jgi:hypothetical protein
MSGTGDIGYSMPNFHYFRQNAFLKNRGKKRDCDCALRCGPASDGDGDSDDDIKTRVGKRCFQRLFPERNAA